jgi:NAD-dependent dihydropyrimidine dehydrogenase PreA subunit
MIELVSSTRCVQCEKCVKICPSNVFESGPGGTPFVARKEDCQTCFLCEAYCPVDALYVAAEAHRSVAVNEEELAAQGLLGKYRRDLGWAKGGNPYALLQELNVLRDKVGSPF